MSAETKALPEQVNQPMDLSFGWGMDRATTSSTLDTIHLFSHFFLTSKKLWMPPFFGLEDDGGSDRGRLNGGLEVLLLGVAAAAAAKKESIGRGDGLVFLFSMEGKGRFTPGPLPTALLLLANMEDMDGATASGFQLCTKLVVVSSLDNFCLIKRVNVLAFRGPLAS